MAVGKVSTRVLTNIANAIRAQNGTAVLYRPSQMAAAVAALDGTQEGEPGVEGYKELETGVVSSKVFDAIGAAIRGQNGEETKYTPGEMAAAILALEWDVGLKARALLLEDGTLEFNYLERRRAVSSAAKIVSIWEVPAAAFAGASARPWDGAKADVTRVAIDSSFAEAGVASCAYWFSGFSALEEVTGFENLSGVSDMTQAFTSCSQLRSIYATEFDYSAVKKAGSMLYGCSRLVGGADGFVPTNSSGASVLKNTAGGVLTDPGNDNRAWLTGELFSDGEVRITNSGAAAKGRTVLASGVFCANAKYNAIQCVPWASLSKQVRSVVIEYGARCGTGACTNYWFYGCTNLVKVDGMSSLLGVAQMQHTFNSCLALASLDLRGFKPGALTSLSYTFGGCSKLASILVDSTWELPSKGLSGLGTFYNCTALVGGNGTAYDSSKTSYAMMRIDKEGQAGYLTAG